MSFKHQYDYTGKCQTEGNEAVELFTELAKNRGYTIQEATQTEDTRQHVDVILVKNNILTKIQIKGRKKLNRNGNFSNEMTCLELHGSHPNGKDRGWLWGKADKIAFRYSLESFIIFDKKLLRNWIYPRVNIENAQLSVKNKTPYQVYYRKEHLVERFTYVYFRDIIIDVPYEFWSKSCIVN